MRALLLIVAASLAGCTNLSGDLLVGSKLAEGGMRGSGPMLTASVRYRVSEHTVCAYSHVSFITKGPPFGDKSEEDSLDAISCGISFGAR